MDAVTDAVLSEDAPAKVNLTLRVVGRRDDGYHLLDSLVVFAAIGDRLTVAPADDLTLTCDGPFGEPLAAEADNLVLRAARCLAAAGGIVPRAAVALTKTLPLAAGIGGGSADAAAALRLLARFWNLAPATEDLQRLALGLGADVPVCLASRPARMAGVGEALSPAPPLPPLGLLLVNPGLACRTASIFRRRGEMASGFSAEDHLPPGGWGQATDLADALAASGNDLEAPAMALAPAIGAVLAAIRREPGCLLARMSGSGATCFGLFPSAGQAALAASRIGGGGWWGWGGDLYDPGPSAL